MKKDITIYHGSQQIVEVPKYGVGKTYNDYGQGFYCTENIELAKEWACPVKNDGYGYESWDDKDRKFYRKILSTETAEVRRISRRIGSAQTELDFERRRKHRWTPAMVDALQKGDSAFLEQCGITEAAVKAMRWRMKSASAREAW